MILSKEEQHKRMIETPIPRLIVTLAIPTTCSQLISTIYNAADTYFVSKIGTSAAAAVGVVFALMTLIQAIGMGTGMGAGSLISRRLGAKQDEDAHRFGSSAFAAAFLFGLVLEILGLIFMEPLMTALGSTDTILPYSCSYARYLLLVAPIMCTSFVLNNILRSQGEAKLAMYGLCTGGILNMILDPIFIFSLNMGIAGAAIATAISQCVSFIILISIFVTGKSIVILSPRYISHNPRDYFLIFKTGLPTICRQGLSSLSTATLNIMARPFGDAVIAGVNISNKLYMLVRNIVLGIGQALIPVAGYNYGAKRNDRVRAAFHFSTRLGTVISIAFALILGLNSGFVMTLFRADDPDAIAIGAFALRCCCAVMPFLGFSTYVNQFSQGLGINFTATFLACCRQGICFMPMVFLLPVVFKSYGIAMAQPAADLLTFFVAIPFLIHVFRRYLPVDPNMAKGE